MKVNETKLKGCFICEPIVFGDNRGYFFEGFNESLFYEKTGVNFKLSQHNCSKSSRGVLRGLHFQVPPFEQAKLVFVTSGEVLDVAVDIRKNSPTYGQHITVILSEENKKRLYVPKGFAHGFVALTETASLSYLVEGNYSPAHDTGIMYNDPDLNIDWILDADLISISEKDSRLGSLSEFNSPF